MYKKLLSTFGLLAVLALVVGFGTFTHASSLPLGGQTYYLAGSGVTTTQNTIQLTYFLTPDGTPITMSEFGTVGYGVLEPQTTSRIEDISFTGITQNANGTATLTGVTRGVQFNYPYGSSISLEKSHAGGSQFIISNTAQFYYNEFAMPNNSNDFTWPTASSSIATKGYVDGIAFGGVLPPASFIAQGVSQLATQIQTASSTVNGSAGVLVIPASNATSTYNAATAPLRVVVTQNSGTIDPNFLALGTSSPLLGGAPVYQSSLYRQFITTTGTTTFSVPTGVTTVQVTVIGGGGGGGGTGICTTAAGFSGAGGGGGGYVTKLINLVGTTTVQVFVGIGGTVANDTAGTAGTWSTFGTNGFYLSANPGTGGAKNDGGSHVSGGSGGTASAGDAAIVGQNGGDGIAVTSSSVAALAGGAGGSTPLGMGAAAGGSNIGTGYGAGGGGAECGGSNTPGGVGSQGIVEINW